MSNEMHRREFLMAAPMATYAFLHAARGGAPAPLPAGVSPRLEVFDYQGVRLLPSRWQAQFQASRNFYFGISNDDILHGYRAAAGFSAPGRPLGGWCAKNSNMVFGQWLSGMARIYRATGDEPMRTKAVHLLQEWAKTIGPDGDCRMDTYAYDKLVCGLVDLELYAGVHEAIPLLEKVTDWADRTFSRARTVRNAADPTTYYGSPHEWYTLSENLYRAYQVTGNPRFARFAEVWLYHPYWNKFADTAAPSDAQGAHAYSHLNTFSSAAMTYAVTGDPTYLRIIRNAYDYFQNTQCYATGGYGPTERLVTPNGSLGRALETRPDTCETPCGSWAVFKLTRYLIQFTGEAHYGDWTERMFYNGIGAALPMQEGGRTFYYADYRVGGGMKTPYWEAFPCCSGTYIQNVADYHNIIYYKDSAGLYVNLYVPSVATWHRPEGEVTITQETRYPEADTTTLTLAPARPMRFALRFRVPRWTRAVSVAVNGTPVPGTYTPGAWGSVTREWRAGDRVEIRIPLVMRMETVDREHPNRVAVVRGPVVLVLDGDWHDPHFRLPEHDDALSQWLVADTAPGVFRLQPPDGSRVMPKFRPFYDLVEDYPYVMYFDRDKWPYRLW